MSPSPVAPRLDAGQTVIPLSGTPAAGVLDTRPPLFRDRTFWGMTATQFLGAFNDNVFKQLVLLLCIDYVRHRSLESDPYQTTAQAIFAIPFVLFSGMAGFLSDRLSKRSILVACKVAEIGVMLAGLIAFLSGAMFSDQLLWALFAVLGLMGLHSTFFGPAKYGVLPELFRSSDLPATNGVIQMTTFLAIIFGMAVCGAAKEFLEGAGLGLWVVSAACIGVAVAGTWTALLVRPTPAAQPELKFNFTALWIDRSTWQLLRRDRTLMGVLLVSSLFWFLGGVLVSTVNAFGKLQMHLRDLHTSLLAASLGMGIAAGCVLAGLRSRHRIRFELVRRGAWGIGVTAAGMAAVPFLGLSLASVEWASAVLLTGMGVAAGLFVVPLQVFLQTRPPEDQKGRMIGAMNLANWIGILLAAAFYGLCSWLFTQPPSVAGGEPKYVISWTFAVIAGLILPIAVWYRPSESIEGAPQG